MRWKSQLAHRMEMPKDLILGTAIVTINGTDEAYIENYVSLMKYTQEKILIQARESRIEIHGSCLFIAFFTESEMKITGKISGVSYC